MKGLAAKKSDCNWADGLGNGEVRMVRPKKRGDRIASTTASQLDQHSPRDWLNEQLLSNLIHASFLVMFEYGAPLLQT